MRWEPEEEASFGLRDVNSKLGRFLLMSIDYGYLNLIYLRQGRRTVIKLIDSDMSGRCYGRSIVTTCSKTYGL
jgi:hypothetical protein